jgi:hypothetical protein
MISGVPRRSAFLSVCLALSAAVLQAQTATPSPASSKSSSSAKPANEPADSVLDPGTVTNGVYRNKTLALSCKIPAGWVLRTVELNARDEKNGEDKNEAEKKEGQKTEEEKKDAQSTPTAAASSTGAKVLLAAFSRPPEARAEDVNASILIAAESAAAYPELKEAAQYFFPLTEVAKAQGFTPDEDPYEIAVGTKTLIRGDFHKDRGSRVMHQSTLAMLSHGYAISITVIGGTDDEVEDLIDGLTFTPSGK